MTTIYTHRVTTVCPESMIADANQLALVIGTNPADNLTFRETKWQDESGNLYAVSSTVATDAFEGNVKSQLEAPDYSPEADLTAAGRAQAALYIYGQHGTEGAAPGRLWALVEPAPGNARAAISVAGLKPIPLEPLNDTF